MSTQEQPPFDVAILGWWYGKNYGSILTYYALNRAIEGLGFSTLMVHEPLGYDKWRVKWPDDILSMQFARRIGYEYTEQAHFSELPKLNDQAATFLVGSDQLWNPLIGRVNDDLFLDFVAPDRRRVSYATSFGNRNVKKFKPDFIEKQSANLKRFDAISVRENYGIDTARDIFGVEAQHVADPVFLLPRSDYETLADTATATCEGEYLAVFYLDPNAEKMRVAEEIAKKLGFDRIMVIPNPDKGRETVTQLIRGDQYEVLPEDAPENFLNAYRNAGYVITDSFHGTAFAIIFDKPFSSIYNTKRGVDRFLNLMSHLALGQARRIFETDSAQAIAENPNISREIDLSPARTRIRDLRARSLDWLGAALVTPVTPKPVPAASPMAPPPAATAAGPAAPPAPRPAAAPYGRRARLRRTFERASTHAKRIYKERVPFVHLSGNAPQFETNSPDCTITHNRGVARILVPQYGSRRGNHIWCDLPQTLQKNQAYRLSIQWSLRTQARAVNLHLRNPESGTFHVIGAARLPGRINYNRKDSFDFIAPAEGLSQLMLGALHFSGVGAEAQIVSVGIKQISRSEMTEQKTGPTRVEQARQLAMDDHERFVSGYAAGKSRSTLVSARSRMMFHTHAIEKGLSHNDLRPGFGRVAVPGLAGEMNSWLIDGRDPQDVFYQTSATVMKAYFDRHREIGRDVSDFHRLFDAPVRAHIEAAGPVEGGVLDMTLPRERHQGETADRPFMDVVYGRRSIREFTPEPVSDDLIRQAVQIAMQAPSVCNRQSGRVHVIDDPKVMRDVLKVQGGFSGYEMPPRLLLVTSHLPSFLFVAERNQPYIDGGLFMMNLLLGLTQLGLGSCSLNTAMNTTREAKIRARLGISDQEVFIAFVAVGYFDPAVLTPRSKRLELEDIIIRH